MYYICSIQKQRDMILTKKQNAELNNLKNKIEHTEDIIANAQISMYNALELEDKKEVIRLENVIKLGFKRIEKSVSIQAEVMKLEYNIVLDLIFDREYTLQNLKNLC